jgi:hypothetical protein
MSAQGPYHHHLDSPFGKVGPVVQVLPSARGTTKVLAAGREAQFAGGSFLT